MTKLPNDIVLRLAEEAWRKSVDSWRADPANKGRSINFDLNAKFNTVVNLEFAALIQAELEKTDNEVSDAHDLLDRHQVPRNTKFGIPLSLLGRIAASFMDEQL